MTVAQRFAHWEAIRRGLLAALDKLDDQQLQFVPREGLWSLGRTACHIAVSEYWWAYWVRGQRPPQDDRPRCEDYVTLAALRALLARSHALALAALEGIPEGVLADEIETPWGARCTVEWAIWHIVEHEIHHRGEIYLMLGLLGMDAPEV